MLLLYSGSPITSFYTKSFRTWDTLTGASLATSIGLAGAIRCVTFSPDGFQLASGGDDGSVRIWDSRTHEVRHILLGHRRRVSSGSYDNTVQTWNTTTGDPGFIPQDHSDYVIGVTYSPSGHQIATCSYDSTMQGRDYIYLTLIIGGWLRVWKVVERDDAYNLPLVWGKGFNKLNMANVSIDGVVGLSPANLALMELRGVISTSSAANEQATE
ncbi:Chromatin assembly factor 1 subunit B [Mortierella sp. GBA35]|nr:Chromatin assembly factor 1 subunit B [Mortierella sp. GBA35]